MILVRPESDRILGIPSESMLRVGLRRGKIICGKRDITQIAVVIEAKCGVSRYQSYSEAK